VVGDACDRGCHGNLSVQPGSPGCGRRSRGSPPSPSPRHRETGREPPGPQALGADRLAAITPGQVAALQRLAGNRATTEALHLQRELGGGGSDLVGRTALERRSGLTYRIAGWRNGTLGLEYQLESSPPRWVRASNNDYDLVPQSRPHPEPGPLAPPPVRVPVPSTGVPSLGVPAPVRSLDSSGGSTSDAQKGKPPPVPSRSGRPPMLTPPSPVSSLDPSAESTSDTQKRKPQVPPRPAQWPTVTPPGPVSSLDPSGESTAETQGSKPPRPPRGEGPRVAAVPPSLSPPGPSGASTRGQQASSAWPPSPGSSRFPPTPSAVATPPPPAEWLKLPPNVRTQLTDIWNAWQRGDARESDFYDAFWKRSDVKPTLQRPSADQYVAALKARGLLGETSEASAKQSKTGYPLSLPHKGRSTMPVVRVYVNPHPAHVADVYAFVTERVYPLEGVMWVKVADHAVAMRARDVIVIYIDPKPDPNRTVADVTSAFAEYQSGHRGQFLDEVIRLGKPLLRGVAVGAEPPTPEEFGELFGERYAKMDPDEKEHYNLGQGYQTSFSQYRADVVKRALIDAKGDHGRYMELIPEYFAVAGIDASHADVQEPAQPGIVDLLKIGYYES
jgi:hypothetical protein